MPARTSPSSGAKQRRDELDKGEIDALLAALRLHAQTHDEARRCVDYVTRNRSRMRYPEFRARGLCAASGVVEAGCKVTIGTRLKRAGMHWSVDGANAIIAPRCCQLSGASKTSGSGDQQQQHVPPEGPRNELISQICRTPVVDLDRTARVLRALRPNIVGLQVVSERATRSGGVPQTGPVRRQGGPATPNLSQPAAAAAAWISPGAPTAGEITRVTGHAAVGAEP